MAGTVLKTKYGTLFIHEYYLSGETSRMLAQYIESVISRVGTGLLDTRNLFAVEARQPEGRP